VTVADGAAGFQLAQEARSRCSLSLMINRIELHDSQLLGIDVEAGTVLINAYVHRLIPGARREGGTQRVVFRFSQFRMRADCGEPTGIIYDGTLVAAGIEPDELLSLPFEISTPVELRIVSGDGVTSSLEGDALTIEEAGPYIFVEFWPE
jgi:hypothetical protein